MGLKKLAYLKIKIKHLDNEFCELYTFQKPTILYLPEGLILNVKSIEKYKICLIINSKFDEEIHQTVVLSLCDVQSKKIVLKCESGTIIICLKLCAINILKPCCNPCDCECRIDCDDKKECCYDSYF
ncbi:MAG: hypothetical protein RR404_01505 [Bacilli bacterium]